MFHIPINSKQSFIEDFYSPELVSTRVSLLAFSPKLVSSRVFPLAFSPKLVSSRVPFATFLTTRGDKGLGKKMFHIPITSKRSFIEDPYSPQTRVSTSFS